MKFVYGKNDWKTLRDGQKNCYLLTNGLGGFSALTMIGSNARNDHALLMACFNKENKRCHMITNLSEVVEINGERHHLLSQELVNITNNKYGFQYLNTFYMDRFPKWIYQVQGVEIHKTIAMRHGRNCVAVKYDIINRTSVPIQFEASPYMQFIDKGMTLMPEQTFTVDKHTIKSNGMILHYKTNGELKTYPSQFIHDLYYHYDARDGREAIGAAVHNHKIKINVPSGESKELYLIYDTEEIEETIDTIFASEMDRIDRLIEKSEVTGEVARRLVISSDQFIVEKAAVNGKTIIAGYPFFMDWGRDTMIALSGCCIATNRFEEAKSIFRSFMKYCQKGLMPNIFPEGGNEPFYNTVDASLLFINALYEYFEASRDLDFVKEAYDTAADIIDWYRRGTDFHIHMEVDGLITAGGEKEQVTWMDVCCNGFLPTPRHGKPVEINAYWYNALKIMSFFSELLRCHREEYDLLADKVKANFCKQFWMEEQGYLKDVVSGTKADVQLRCNQIWAVSVPFSMLTEEQQRKIVDKVYERLYTPYGLRSLEKADEEFHPTYGGSQFNRDMAYHQGTVWAFPLGAYYMAYLKVQKDSVRAVENVREQLLAIETCMREGCVGQIAEIFDGDYPSESKGCFAQAWSVSEILKVYKKVEEIDYGR